MPRTVTRRKADQMMEITRLYIEAGGAEPVDLDKLADFAIDNGHWHRGNIAALRKRMCKRDFSQAFREQYHSDSQGRHVRTWHAKIDREGPRQTTLWGDMRTAPEEHMEVAFQQRRQQIVGDCTQLKTERYNRKSWMR